MLDNSSMMFVGEPSLPFEMMEDDSDDDYGFFLDADNADYDDDDDASTDNDNSAAFVTCCPSHELIYASRIIDITNPHSLHTHPPILSPSIVDTIVEDGLPWSMQDSRWNRLFAAARDDVDGPSSFVTFMRRVRDHDQTIIVAKSSTGRIVGGYATNVWSGRRRNNTKQQHSKDHDFLFVVESPTTTTTTTSTKSKLLHTGMTFMNEDHQQLLLGKSPTSTASHFDTSSSSSNSSSTSTKHRRCNNNDSNKPRIEIFKQDHNHQKYDDVSTTTTAGSSSSSSWKQACHMGRTLLSMSSDTSSCGKLSLVIHHSFSRGEISLGGSGGTTREEGVGNDCSMEEFDIVEFEVYGLTDED